MKVTRLACLLISSAALAPVACVTVNVNFPEATVQKATDDYVRELYRAKEKGRAQPGSESSPQPTSLNATPPQSKPFELLEAFFIPSAQAVEVSTTFKVEGAKVEAIQKRQEARLDKLLAAKRAGQLGETNDGMVTVEHGGKLKDMLKKSLEPLIAAENEDRKELYKEILRINSVSDARLKDLQKSFARSFQSLSPSGTWIQDPDGKWARKP